MYTKNRISYIFKCEIYTKSECLGVIMKVKIGHYQQQDSGYKAFVPLPFPPEQPIKLSSQLEFKHSEAMRLIGKLDGITQLLPDKDFFLLMFVRREAASSSQIEGTRATMVDAIKAEVVPSSELPDDVEDIIHYVSALNYGLDRFQTLPISVRFICELHERLLQGARSTQHSFPGEFRKTQNWIGGTSPNNALFIPPPPYEMSIAMSDLEKFIHSKNDGYLPLLKIALIHAQFETIHPFCDGNGRAGRLLITMYLWQEKLLEKPVLYLSDFFKKHQKLYYDRLQAYHDNSAVEPWIDFFLEGIIDTAEAVISIAHEINKIHARDMKKVHKLGKVAAKSAVDVLHNLYRQPIVGVSTVQKWTGFTYAGAQKVIDRLVKLEILALNDQHKTYGKTYEYTSYIRLFW